MDYGGGHQIGYQSIHQEIKEAKTAKSLFKRRLEIEKNWEKDLLETDFIKKIVGASHYYCPVDKVAKSLTFLLELGWKIQDWKGNDVIKQSSSQLFVNDANYALTIKGKLHYETYEADVSSVMGAFNRKERFVQISPGKVGLLPDKWEQAGLQELAEIGEIVGADIKIRKTQIGSISSLLEQANLEPTLIDFREKLNHFNKIERAAPDARFLGTLRPYQQEGLNWLSFLVDYGLHGILADDMGLGKTVQTLALLSRLPTDRPHLIVAPTSLLFNWKNEIERFIPHFKVYVHYGTDRALSNQELSSYFIILTSYNMLRIDFSFFQTISYFSVILDEAGVIKNAETQTAQIVCRLQARFRLCITGTPLENHLSELWSHFRFLIPDLFGSRETFEADLQASLVDSRYLQRIKKKIKPFILRRKKEEVAKDLPERINQTVLVDMPVEQRRLYDQFLAGVKGNLLKKAQEEGVTKHRMEILEAILRLRQICCHPLLVSSYFQEEDFNPLITSAKLEALEQDLDTALEEGRKVLVYSQFTSMLKLMKKKAEERGWLYAYLDGSTKDREKVVSSFQNDPTISIFFISLKAGGVGLNLTAADYVFLYDPWWNEAVEEQAISRAHRIGRQQTVIAKRFITIESIEEKMMKLKAMKTLLVENMLEGNESSVELTLDDLRYLLS